MLKLQCLGSNPAPLLLAIRLNSSVLQFPPLRKFNSVSAPVLLPSLTVQVQVQMVLYWSAKGPFPLQTLTGWPQLISSLDL